MVTDAECQVRLPHGEGFIIEDDDRSQTPRFLADAMRNIGLSVRRRAPTSSWFALIGLHSIIGSVAIYRADCSSSKSEPHAPNPVLTSILRRLDTWYGGLEPSIRLIDRCGVVLGAAAMGADETLSESPHSIVVMIHGLLVYHGAECVLLGPPGNVVTESWWSSQSAVRWKQALLRSGMVMRAMSSAGENGKLSTPFHVFNVHVIVSSLGCCV